MLYFNFKCIYQSMVNFTKKVVEMHLLLFYNMNVIRLF